MPDHLGSDLYLDIRNPEYMPRGEVLISELVALKYESDAFGTHSDGVVEGRIYRARARGDRSVRIVSTDPYGLSSPNDPAEWESALDDAGLVCDDALDQAAWVLAGSFAGLESKKGKGQAATPMTPGLALLQDARGVVGRRNPYNVALAIERMYTLGGSCPPVEDRNISAVKQWIRAAESRLEADSLLRLLDTGAKEALLRNFSLKGDDPQQAGGAPKNPCLGPNTPFSWFRVSWDRLTSEEWVEALPARTWTDWAIAVIRAGLAFGYLWEIRWYETITKLILRGGSQLQEVGWEDLVLAANRHGPLLEWGDQTRPVGLRDVASSLKAKCLTYAALQEEVKTTFTNANGEAVGEALLRASRDSEIRARFHQALQSNSNPNCHELVRYMLLAGEEQGRYADYYGLLEKVGPRYSVVNPATEWVAVVASLSMDVHAEDSTLNEVSASLKRLGLQPSNEELIKHLHLAGLARGAPDADGAVVVKSAF